jgi:hypothetical protein
MAVRRGIRDTIELLIERNGVVTASLSTKPSIAAAMGHSETGFGLATRVDSDFRGSTTAAVGEQEPAPVLQA